MRAKPVRPRERARSDVDEAVDEAVDHYVTHDKQQAALDFIDALERAYVRIGRHPAAGSPRYAHELGIAGLRSWRLHRFPYLIFYVERTDHVDVWRVLHAQRDIAEWLSEGP